MDNKKGFIVMNSIMNFVNAAALTVTGALLNHAMGPAVLWQILVAFVFAWIVTLVIPVQKLGYAFAGLFRLRPQTLACGLVANVVIELIYVGVINFAMTVINVGFVMPALWFAYIGVFPVLYVVSYVLSVLVEPLAARIAFGKK